MKNIIRITVVLCAVGFAGLMMNSDLVVSSSNPLGPPPAVMAGLNFAEEVTIDEVTVKTADQISDDSDLLAHVSLDNDIPALDDADIEPASQ